MALFARLKDIHVLRRCLKLTLAPHTGFHSLSRAPHGGSLVGKRTFFLRILQKPSVGSLKKADDIPDAFDLIYRNTMSKYILGAQIISLVTGGVVLMALFLKTDYKDFERDTLGWSSKSRPTKYEEFYYVSIFLVILVLMQVMIGRTPIRIYKVPKTPKYIGINYGNYFFGKERFSFSRGEISQMGESGILPWKDSRFVIQTKSDRKSVILLEQYFRRPADLSIMLGEQKDPDLEELKTK